jgi:hypothetical protein
MYEEMKIVLLDLLFIESLVIILLVLTAFFHISTIVDPINRLLVAHAHIYALPSERKQKTSTNKATNPFRDGYNNMYI